MRFRNYRKHIFTVQVASILMSILLLSGCGAPKIEVAGSGKEYALSDIVQVTSGYDTYNIQAPIEKVADSLATEGIKSVTIKSHSVEAAKKETSEGGKYDAVDSVRASLEGADLYGALPQTIDVTIEFKRLKGTETWEQTGIFSNEWDINHNKLGGTIWRETDGDVTYYYRFSNAVEFLYEDTTETENSAQYVVFYTTIPSVYIVQEGDNITTYKALILSGTVTSDGVVTLKDFQEDEIPEIVLSDFEKIEKSEYPISEDEYKELIAR